MLFSDESQQAAAGEQATGSQPEASGGDDGAQDDATSLNDSSPDAEQRSGGEASAARDSHETEDADAATSRRPAAAAAAAAPTGDSSTFGLLQQALNSKDHTTLQAMLQLMYARIGGEGTVTGKRNAETPSASGQGSCLAHPAGLHSEVPVPPVMLLTPLPLPCDCSKPESASWRRVCGSAPRGGGAAAGCAGRQHCRSAGAAQHCAGRQTGPGGKPHRGCYPSHRHAIGRQHHT